jgi:hypothetical protein
LLSSMVMPILFFPSFVFFLWVSYYHH